MKKRKKAGVGALKNIPYEQIVGGVLGATTAKVLVPKLTEKVAFLQENPMLVNAAKIALGVGLTMMSNPWAMGAGVGMAAEGAAELLREPLQGMIGTVMDNTPTPINLPYNPNAPKQLPYGTPAEIFGLTPNGYSSEEAFINGNTDIEVDY